MQVVGLREIVMIRELKRQGLGVSAIARQTGLDRKTVKKYLERGLEAPDYGRGSRPNGWRMGSGPIWLNGWRRSPACLRAGCIAR